MGCCNLYSKSIKEDKNNEIIIECNKNNSLPSNDKTKNHDNSLMDLIKSESLSFNHKNFKNKQLGVSSFDKPPLIGLANIGATCYMNATLQCLSNIKKLTNYFLINQKKYLDNNSKYDLSKEYAKLIDNLWNKNQDKKYYEPYDFKNKIGDKIPLFKGIAANDSKDSILFIFEQLHKELNEPNINELNNMNNLNNNNINNQIFDQRNEKNQYELFKKDYYAKNNSIIQKIFYGEQESLSHCFTCNVTTYNFNIFNFLIFPLEKVRLYLINKNKNGFANVTLENCFEQYISKEIMSGSNQMYCNYCHNYSDYSMNNIIYKHPEVLVIILYRGKALEFDVEFDYPNFIQINNFINLENNDNYNNSDIIEYELISVITHLGESSMSGHFIAYCKSPVDNNWYLYNDAIVTKCNNLNRNNNSNLKSIPYVLFYQITKKNNSNNLLFSSDSKINNIVLYFNFPNEKELFLEVDENIIFNDALKSLSQKNGLGEINSICFNRKNNKKIEGSKSIKENNLMNGDHIIIKGDFEI